MNSLALMNRSKTKKFTALILIVALVLLLCDRFLFRSYHVKTATHHTLAWMYNHDALVLGLHILFMTLFTSFFVPPALLVLTSGFIFHCIYHGCGFVIACVASLLGAAIGGTIAFSRASHMSHEMLDVLVGRYPILNVVDTAIVKSPLRVMMLLRLNPLIPFGVLNYVFAMKGLNISPFIVSMASVMQWYLLLTCIGAWFSNIYNGYAYAGYAIGAACGVVVMAVQWYFAKRELQKEVECHHLKEVLPVNQVKEEETSTCTHETKGSRMKRLASKLKLSKKKPRKSSDTSSECSRSVAASEPVDNNAVENSDLSGFDYVRMQVFGRDRNSGSGSKNDYRKKLDAAEVVLDDFS